MKIKFRKWESYFSTRQAIMWYLRFTCCLKKKYKLKKQKDISEQLERLEEEMRRKAERERKDEEK